VDEAVFLPRGDRRYVATELARGPWDPQAQHGGAPAALLVREFELTEPGAALMLARVTFEFVRPVPLGELDVSAQVVKPGRRVQLLEGTVLDASGNEVVRARALRVGRTEVSSDSDGLARPPGPDQGVLNDYPAGDTMFGSHTMEIRFVEGAFMELGPATAWFRLRYPLVSGESTSPLQRLAAAGDFGNGISSNLSWSEHTFINPDLTLYAEREPAGEWICLQSQTRVSEGAVGIAESVLFDQRGQVGRATQALLVGRR
jgi:Thioesterase-like superfamily